MKTKRKTMGKKRRILPLLAIILVVLSICGNSVFADKDEQTKSSDPAATASGLSGNETSPGAGSSSVGGDTDETAVENPTPEGTGINETAVQTANSTASGKISPLTILLILIGVLLSLILSLIIVDRRIENLKTKRFTGINEIIDRLDLLENNYESYAHRLGQVEKRLYDKTGGKTPQKADSYGTNESDIPEIQFKLMQVDARLKDLEKRLIPESPRDDRPRSDTYRNNITRSETSTYSQKGSLFNQQSDSPRRMTVTLAVEDKYNEMKQAGNERGFISEFHCEKIGIANYEGRTADPNSSIILEKGGPEWFLAFEDRYRNFYAVPVFDAQLKSRYFGMFSTIFNIQETNSTSDFKLLAPARLKALGGGKYEVIEKGSLEI